MKTKWIEVACTTYQTVLVEVEATEDACMYNKAIDLAVHETGADDTEICCEFDEKPSKNNLSMYDEVLEM